MLLFPKALRLKRAGRTPGWVKGAGLTKKNYFPKVAKLSLKHTFSYMGSGIVALSRRDAGETVCCWNWSIVVLEHSLRCDCGVYRPVISCLYRSALFIECHYASSNCGISPIQTNKVKKKYRNISVNLNYMGQQYDIRVVQKITLRKLVSGG